MPSVRHVTTRELFWGVVQSGPQKPGEHSTLKLMVMWDMLWNPVNVISSVKSAPSWRLSRSINKLSIMFGSPLSMASMKNCICPWRNYNYTIYPQRLSNLLSTLFLTPLVEGWMLHPGNLVGLGEMFCSFHWMDKLGWGTMYSLWRSKEG